MRSDLRDDDLLVLFWLMEVDEWSHHLVDQQPAIVCRIPRVTAFWPRDVHKRKFMQPLATGFQWSHCLSDAPSSFESALHGIDAVDVALVMWVSASWGFRARPTWQFKLLFWWSIIPCKVIKGSLNICVIYIYIISGYLPLLAFTHKS